MKITLKNCNSIDDGEIWIEEGKLNLKYAMNGTGKSTIAKAIELQVRGESLDQLLPFKHFATRTAENLPSATGLDGIQSIAIFNDAYINQFAFKSDEVIANSFEIFIKTEDYDRLMKEIEENVNDIRKAFSDSEEINTAIADLVTLSDCFGNSKKGYSEAGTMHKAIGSGNKIANIPKGLEGYSVYLQSSDNVRWIKWQMDGNSFSGLSDDCPYCVSPTLSKKETIAQVSKEYNSNLIQHLNKFITVIEGLGRYFTDETNKQLSTLSTSANGPSAEGLAYLLQIKGQIDLLKSKLIDLKSISFFTLKDVAKLADHFNSYKIELSYFPALDTENTTSLVTKINSSIEAVVERVGILQGKIEIQKKLIATAITENKTSINYFLQCAGYKYIVDVEFSGDQYKMRLKHIDHDQSLSNGSQHLSYGERNAFSLVLFMFECLARKHSLIILDDPISSFDKNKKYAVMDMLFRGKKSFRDRTVLMLSHDFEPVIDITYTMWHKLHPVPNVTFVDNKLGRVREMPITKSDIQTFTSICKAKVEHSSQAIVKLVFLRRLQEINTDKGLPYQLLSNLLHKREIPFTTEWNEAAGTSRDVPLTTEEIEEASIAIRMDIPDFDYHPLLIALKDENAMKADYLAATSNYEKLQIFRVLKDKELSESDVINKFINEVFHIENDYIMQLDPSKYEVVPEYIIRECDKLVEASS